MTPAEELDHLTRLCRSLGATPEAAPPMAAQLQKRCDQLTAQRSLTREQAMDHLLQLVTHGSQGVAPPGFTGVQPGAATTSVIPVAIAPSTPAASIAPPGVTQTDVTGM